MLEATDPMGVNATAKHVARVEAMLAHFAATVGGNKLAVAKELDALATKYWHTAVLDAIALGLNFTACCGYAASHKSCHAKPRLGRRQASP